MDRLLRLRDGEFPRYMPMSWCGSGLGADSFGLETLDSGTLQGELEWSGTVRVLFGGEACAGRRHRGESVGDDGDVGDGGVVHVEVVTGGSMRRRHEGRRGWMICGVWDGVWVDQLYISGTRFPT